MILQIFAHICTSLVCCFNQTFLLKQENPCQHPIIILRDVGFTELAAILHFMYHGQVMVEQERIPQLLQTAQMLEVRGLCEVKEGDSGNSNSAPEDREAETSKVKGNHLFLSGLLGQTSVSATKRSITASNSNSCNNSSSSPPAAKRQRSSSRPVPMLQSILSQQLAAPATPMFDLTKTMGGSSSSRALTALASKVQGNSSNAVSTSTSALLPTSLENLLGGLPSTSTGHVGDRAEVNCGSHCSTTSFQDEDTSDRDASKVESSSCGEPSENRDSGHEGAAELEPDTVVQIKEEPSLDFDDDFCDDSDTRGGATGDDEAQSESENEMGHHGEGNGRGEASLLPLLAQHLAAPSLLSASAKLRAAASQARNLRSSSAAASADSPLMAQALLAQPSSPPDMGPSSMGHSSDAASPSKSSQRCHVISVTLCLDFLIR